MRIDTYNRDRAKLKYDHSFDMRKEELNRNYGDHSGWYDSNGQKMYDNQSQISRRTKQGFGKSIQRNKSMVISFIGTQLKGMNIFNEKIDSLIMNKA
tara:strand:+ start:243 stop:533 length:291 start_codon:yes stop_codon:yes gene_type:complete